MKKWEEHYSGLYETCLCKSANSGKEYCAYRSKRTGEIEIVGNGNSVFCKAAETESGFESVNHHWSFTA